MIKMMKKTAAFMLACTMMFGSTAFAETAPPASPVNTNVVTSETGTKILSDALSAGIIDSMDKDWSESITREQFCEYAYNALNSVKELPQAKLVRNPFDDVINYKINALSFVKIVSGKGEYIFAPNDKITREEVATILCRMAEYAGAELPKAKVDVSYSDNDDISPWALSAVYSLKILDIFGNATKEFQPKAEVSAEEAVSSLLSLHNYIKK